MKKDANLLRVGVLGAGLIAQAAHLEACRKARNVELYALCDAAPDLLAGVASMFGPAKTFADYDELLSDSSIDAVIVAVADQFHVPMAIRAIEAGKHVLVEKPMGVGVGECERLRDISRTHPRVHVQVGTMRRFDPGIAFAQAFIRDEIGELLALKAWYCDSVYRYTETDNLHPVIISSSDVVRPVGDPKADRFAYYLLGHGSHLVDTARFLGGEILAVRADYREKFGAHSWFVSIEFANGALGHLDLTIPVRMEWHEGFQVYGEKGSVVAKSFNPWYFKASEVECFSTSDHQYHRLLGTDGHSFRRQVEGFADVILHGIPPAGAGVEDGLAAMRALSAIAHSARIGSRVALADAPGSI
ncbi:MAG: Gfo/Idh/MocA family oxidoreductase [Terrimicrobiaceae bacterium]